MKKNLWISMLIIFVLIITYGFTFQNEEPEKLVLIKTDYGVMKVKLYNETPLHRDNFIKLAKEGYYNGLLFHRVIKGFMVQGGDPDSRGSSPTKRLGGGGPNYQIDAEIRPELMHKKGALAAARQGDNVNPERKSSGSQFYLVQGKVYSPEELKQFIEQLRFRAIREEGMKIFRLNQEKIARLQQEGKKDSLEALMFSIQQAAEKGIDTTQFQIGEERAKVYSTIGGTPFLDGSYTVFGEVIEGIEIIDSIANQQVGTSDRPLKDISMTVEVIE